MITYRICSKGYVATGTEGRRTPDHFHGVSKGNDFREACINFSKDNPNFNKYFDKERLTYWGCPLYDGTEPYN